MDCGPVEELTHWIHVLGIIDARAADKLTDNDTFCPIDDEVPVSVIRGKSPIKTVDSLISPVSL